MRTSRRLFPLLAITAAVATLGWSRAARASTAYTVTVPGESSPVVHVSASFALESSTIGMVVTSSPQLEGGQASLVRDLVVRNADGKAIDHEYAGEGDWHLRDAGEGEQIEIEYDVALEHDQYQWGPGIDEVAYRNEDGLFFTGFSLFIIPGMRSTEAVEVRFELPDTWHASTPWERIAPDAEVYRAATVMDLARNCLFVGEHLEESVAVGDFTFVLAIGGDLKAKKPLFVEVMAPVLPAYVETFGGMPHASRYLVVINPGKRSDGGAFLGSYSMLIKGEVNRASSVVWGHGIAHELAHFWNGHTIVPASDSDEEWFKEGFTDYITIVQLSRTGLDSWAVTSRKLENIARRYIIAKRLMGISDSMRAAGADKHRKRFLVYGGGALIGLALDVRIREATQNRAGLDDLLQVMYREFGATGRRYRFADVVRVASQVSGSDQKEFFERFVDGSEFLDIGPTFDAIGLQLTTMMDEFYLSRRDGATPAQRAIARSIFGPGGV